MRGGVFFEKPSKHSQWQERQEAPIAVRSMSPAEIENFRCIIAKSYKCKPDDITYEFKKIFDKDDMDRDDCLLLRYNMVQLCAGKPTNRPIFSLKVPIPEEVRRMAEHVRRTAMDRDMARQKLAIMPAETSSTPGGSSNGNSDVSMVSVGTPSVNTTHTGTTTVSTIKRTVPKMPKSMPTRGTISSRVPRHN